MPSFYVEIICEAIDVKSDARFKKLVDEIAVALFALDDGKGARFAGTPRKRHVTFGYRIDASTNAVAGRKALAVTRTALHAAGGATPDWPTDFPIVEKSVTREKDLAKV